MKPLAVLIMLTVFTLLPVHAQEPSNLLGTLIADPGSLRPVSQSAAVAEALLDELLDLPARAGIEALRAARPVDLTRRGSKEVG